ncbi:hypothetical protein C9374_005689 [Naegleria lovaniensis]|uniref:Uncharacterized protein n=1 Tax=Naegleria lovaniensis TaxID=51637 RepID=A0AA88GP45_NAELO|nr:uncharacterized protein C9374_005689 [Naegleria lovaniensis]KAG2381897.1 hypothetical protein C9374_005689 [Naegleria lovaniensis]
MLARNFILRNVAFPSVQKKALLFACASKMMHSSSQYEATRIFSFGMNGSIHNNHAYFTTNMARLTPNEHQQPLDESSLSQHIFQFIQGHSENLPLQSFNELDKLLQTLIFQAHLVYRAKSLDEWRPLYNEILNILINNSQIFAELDQNQVKEYEADIKSFGDAIIGTFEKYGKTDAATSENKEVANFLRLLAEDIVISALPTVKTQNLYKSFLQNVISEMEAFSKTASSQQFKVILLARQALCYHKIGELENALKTADRVVELMPTFAPGYLVRASTQLFLDQPQQAIIDCNQALELEPGNLEAYLCRAVSYLKLGEDDKALSDLNTLLDMYPSRFDALTKRSGIYFGKKQYDRAIIDLERALFYNQNDVQVFQDVIFSFDCQNDKFAEQLIIGLFNKHRGQAVDSVKAFDESIKIDSSDPVAYHQRGLLLYNYMGQPNDAAKDFEAALDRRGRLTSDDYLGIVLQDYGMVVLNSFVSEFKDKPPSDVPTFETAPQLKKAYRAFEEATTKLPPQAQLKALSSIGSIHVIMNENEKGIETFTKAIELSKPREGSQLTQELRSEIAAAYFNRAHVYHMKMLNNEAALKDYSIAIKLNPGNPLFYHYRSMLHISMGNDDLAKKDDDLAKKITERQQQKMKEMQQIQEQMANNQPPQQ